MKVDEEEEEEGNRKSVAQYESDQARPAPTRAKSIDILTRVTCSWLIRF